MPRLLIVKQDSDLQSLGGRLLKSKLTPTQAEAALGNLQALNPHLKAGQPVSAGTVVLVPDEPGFKASESESVGGGPLEDFEELVRAELAAGEKKLKASNAARAEQRAEVASVQKTAAFKKIVEADPALKDQFEEASKALKEDQKGAAVAEQALDAATKGALAELAALIKLAG
jgi:hypothetical protein